MERLANLCRLDSLIVTMEVVKFQQAAFINSDLGSSQLPIFSKRSRCSPPLSYALRHVSQRYRYSCALSNLVTSRRIGTNRVHLQRQDRHLDLQPDGVPTSLDWRSRLRRCRRRSEEGRSLLLCRIKGDFSTRWRGFSYHRRVLDSTRDLSHGHSRDEGREDCLSSEQSR